MSGIHDYFNNAVFKKLLAISRPAAAIKGILFLILGLYFSFFASPADYQQGNSVRIMYVHVPSAWMSLLCYGIIFCSSISYLVWRNPNADLTASATTIIGACFTFITLVTGSLWGKPMWGTWWVWDARLTSVLILFLLYLGLIALRTAHENSDKGKKLTAILAIIGFINIPIIKFSVDWWNTLHQPASVFKMQGPTIASSMLIPLFLMFAAFLCYYIYLLSVMVDTTKASKKMLRHSKKNK